MDKTINISCIYGVSTLFSFLLVCGYYAFARKKDIWLVLLYFSVFVVNIGYFTLSISRSLEWALMANRVAYFGSVFLPFFMLMIIIKVCHLICPKGIIFLLLGLSFLVFLLAASQGYTDWYYEDARLVFVNDMAKLDKVYGPLHSIYFVYLLAYFSSMLGVICHATVKKKHNSYKYAGFLIIVVLSNMAIWFVEQLIDWDFEFLAVSYISSELLLLFLNSMIEDYENVIEYRFLHVKSKACGEMDIIKAEIIWPEIAKLSDREKDVLAKILEGKKRKDIANELYISENTVKKHISNIFSKLQIANRDELYDHLTSGME